MAKFIVNAYRIREIVSIDYDTNLVSFLIEDGPDGSDDVTCPLQNATDTHRDDFEPKAGDYWVNPFGDGHYVAKRWFEQTYLTVS